MEIKIKMLRGFLYSFTAYDYTVPYYLREWLNFFKKKNLETCGLFTNNGIKLEHVRTLRPRGEKGNFTGVHCDYRLSG